MLGEGIGCGLGEDVDSCAEGLITSVGREVIRGQVCTLVFVLKENAVS